SLTFIGKELHSTKESLTHLNQEREIQRHMTDLLAADRNIVVMETDLAARRARQEEYRRVLGFLQHLARVEEQRRQSMQEQTVQDLRERVLKSYTAEMDQRVI